MRTAITTFLVCALSAAQAAPRPILTAEGIGPLHIGMTLQQAETAIGRKIDLGNNISDDANVCAEVEVPGWRGVGLLLEDLRISVIYLNRPHRTIDGVHIGTTEYELKKLFGLHAVFDYRPYLGDDPHSHNVIVKVSSKCEFLFQTKDSKVETISMRDLPSVEYWEGCA